MITDSFTVKCLKYHTGRVEEDTRRSCSECFPALFAQMLSFALISVPISIHLECALKSGVSNAVTFIWPLQRWIFGSRTKRRVSGIKVWTVVANLLWAAATKWADEWDLQKKIVEKKRTSVLPIYPIMIEISDLLLHVCMLVRYWSAVFHFCPLDRVNG